MTKTISFKAVTITGLILFFLGTVAVAQANHSWGKYHWDLSTADTEADALNLVDNLTNGWSTNLATASTDWNVSVLKNEVVEGGSNANCDPTAGSVEVCNGEYSENGWLGIASIWATRGKSAHITQGVVMLNDTYFNLPQYNTSAWRNMVMCQEVGHTFGLGHQDEAFDNANLDTCMDYTSSPESNQHPNAHDYEMMTDIYAHLNGTGGGGDGGGNGNGKGRKPSNVGASIDLKKPASWGEAVKQDAQGKNSVYVRNLGNGTELITHVLWAPEQEVEHND